MPTARSETPVAVSTDAETGANPEFAPDNSRLAFSRRGPNAGLYTLELTGSAAVAPLTTTAFDNSAAWQPIPVTCGGRRATIVGTPRRDRLTGTPQADVISGQSGKARDTCVGGKG